MLRDVVGGKEPSAEVFLREVAPAVVGAMDEATLARVTEALRVRLDGSPGTLELRYDYEYCSENKTRRLQSHWRTDGCALSLPGCCVRTCLFR